VHSSLKNTIMLELTAHPNPLHAVLGSETTAYDWPKLYFFSVLTIMHDHAIMIKINHGVQ